MVRDELDVLGATIAHLFAQGVDHVLVSDNLSTDGTRELLAELASRNSQLHLAVDDEPAYHQAEKMTRLAAAATRAGADWIVPFDADEFWFAPGGSLADHLRTLARERPDVGIVRAAFHNMLPVGPWPGPMRMDASPVVPGKVAIRSHPLATLSVGNHGASRVGAMADGLKVAHAAYRSLGQLTRKLRQGTDAVMRTDPRSGMARHWRAGAALSDADLREVWTRITSGESDDRINFRFGGPTVTVDPWAWTLWDPDRVLPDAPAHSMYADE